MDSIDADASIDQESTNVCSICFEIVNRIFDRSSARLKCGHEFHLDCVGSAFNAKGVMQCPNCRDVEKGKWLFANGSRSLPEINLDEWNYDDDQYDNSGMVLGFSWCPYGSLARLPPLIEDGESFSGMPYPDFIGSYLAYFHPPYVFTPEQWNHILLIESRTLHDMGHYNPPYSSPNNHSSNNHSSRSQRNAISSAIVQSSRVHPFFGHGTGSRPRGPPIFSPVPPFMTNPSMPDFPRQNRSHPRQNLQGSREHFYSYERARFAQLPSTNMPMNRHPDDWRFPHSSSYSYAAVDRGI